VVACSVVFGGIPPPPNGVVVFMALINVDGRYQLNSGAVVLVVLVAWDCGGCCCWW